MVDGRNSTTGKRRGSKLSSREEQQQEQSPSDTTTTISKAKGTSSSVTGGGGGIDNFLQRLDEIDLSKRDRKSNNLDGDATGGDSSKSTSPSSSPIKRVGILLAAVVLLVLIYDTAKSTPEKRLLGMIRINDFLIWVKEHPGSGAAAFVLVYGLCVVLLLPGTPLTLGGGYVYKVTYGWVGGLVAGTVISTTGSLVGSCSCFILGRYIMRDRVRKWGRKYPLFDAIDIAVSDNGFKIMCLLYLTPILPLGPVSYMCGTTSMPLLKFAAAKVAALPLMFLYVFIGASTDTFVGGNGKKSEEGTDSMTDMKMGVDEDTHRKMVLFGLCLSIVSMSLVSHFVKKELFKIFDKQKKDKGDETYNPSDPETNEDEHVELISRKDNLMRRPRGHAGSLESHGHDEEKG